MTAWDVTLDIALKYGTMNTHANCNNNNNNERTRYLQHIWNTLHSCGALEDIFDILDTQYKGSFLWCSTLDSHQFIIFIFDVPPLIYRHVSTILFTFVEHLSCYLNYMFLLVYSHNQFST
jgi:hypothetical protein